MLEDKVPNVECTVHLSSVEDGGSDRTPAAVSEVSHVIFSPHDRGLSDVLRPDLL